MSNSETVIQPLHLCSISRSGEAVMEHNPAQKSHLCTDKPRWPPSAGKAFRSNLFFKTHMLTLVVKEQICMKPHRRFLSLCVSVCVCMSGVGVFTCCWSFSFTGTSATAESGNLIGGQRCSLSWTWQVEKQIYLLTNFSNTVGTSGICSHPNIINMFNQASHMNVIKVSDFSLYIAFFSVSTVFPGNQHLHFHIHSTTFMSGKSVHQNSPAHLVWLFCSSHKK